MSKISTDISTIKAEEASKNVAEFLCLSIDEQVRFHSELKHIFVHDHINFRQLIRSPLEELKAFHFG